MRMRDELGAIYEDEAFSHLFPSRGKPGEAPWRLALVTIFQFAENLSDRQAADAVRGRTIVRGSSHSDERRTSVRCWRLPVLVLVIALLGGCGRDSASCAGRTWDLRTPPSRADVGMPPGREWVAWQCDDPQEMRFELPEGATFSLASTLVTFDAYGTPHPETGDPATADVHTGPLGLDVAAETASGILRRLGTDAREIEEWRRQVAAASGTDWVKSPFVRGRAGYLGVEVRVTFHPLSNHAYVHVILLLRD